MAKRVIFKGDTSLDAPFSRLYQRLKAFLAPHIPEYLIRLMEPTREKYDLKRLVRNVKIGQKLTKIPKRVIFKGNGSLDAII